MKCVFNEAKLMLIAKIWLETHLNCGLQVVNVSARHAFHSLSGKYDYRNA